MTYRCDPKCQCKKCWWTPDRVYWRNCWTEALDKMPRHSSKLLLMLIGSYKIYGPAKKRMQRVWLDDKQLTWTTKLGEKPIKYCLANNTVYNNKCRGSKPKDEKAASNLVAIAGPHGLTMAKALAKLRGIKFK